MESDQEPNPFKLPDAPASDAAFWVLYIITAVVLTLAVLMFLNEYLGRPGCTKTYPLPVPTGEPAE